MQIMEHCFDYLRCACWDAHGKDVPMPYAENLEKLALPQIDDILTVVHASVIVTEAVKMPISIKMPALSPTMTDGTLAKWLVKEGDEVRSGDVIAEIEMIRPQWKLVPLMKVLLL